MMAAEGKVRRWRGGWDGGRILKQNKQRTTCSCQPKKQSGQEVREFGLKDTVFSLRWKTLRFASPLLQPKPVCWYKVEDFSSASDLAWCSFFLLVSLFPETNMVMTKLWTQFQSDFPKGLSSWDHQVLLGPRLRQLFDKFFPLLSQDYFFFFFVFLSVYLVVGFSEKEQVLNFSLFFFSLLSSEPWPLSS